MIKQTWWFLILILSCSKFGIPEEAEFVDAIRKGDKALVEAYMRAKANPDARNKFGDPAILWAAYVGNETLVKQLLSRGADPNLKGTGGKTALHWAASGPKDSVLKLLVEGGADINIADNSGVTPLMQAARKNHFSHITYLLAKGAEPDLTDHDGSTALIFAIGEQAQDAVEALVLGGADPEKPLEQPALNLAVKNNQGFFFLTPKILARFPDMEDRIQRIGTGLKVKDNGDRKPPLNVDHLAILLARKVNEARSQHGMPPLNVHPKLESLAKSHASDMVARDYFSTENKQGDDLLKRARDANFQLNTDQEATLQMAENIFRVRRYSGSNSQIQNGSRVVEYHWLTQEQLASQILNEWMKSTANKERIFDQSTTHQGIGAALDNQDQIYIVHDLAGLKHVELEEVSNAEAIPEIDLASLEKRIGALINEKRMTQGLSALPYHAELAAIAKAHSMDMAENEYLDHVNSKGMDPSQRAEAAGYSTDHFTSEYHLKHGVGECLFQGRLYTGKTTEVKDGVKTTTYHWLDQESLAKAVVEGLFSQASNRSNLLSQAFERHGVGVAINEKLQVFVTHNFSKVESLENLEDFRVVNGKDRPNLDKKALALLIHNEVNRTRKLHNVKPLKYDPALAEIAEGHSKDMARKNYFSHRDKAGGNASDRAQKVGFAAIAKIGDLVRTGIGENIYRDRLYKSMKVRFEEVGGQLYYDWHNPEELAKTVVQGWMDSPGHRENLLNAVYESEGLGIAIGEEERIYFTQNFF